MSLKHKDYKEANMQFLEENLNEEGVMELPCGVQYKVILQGKGPVPGAKSTVKVHYKGTMIDGTVFDDSFSRKRPESFRVNEVITGWQEALQAMPLGSRWIIYIPYMLGYGTRAAGKIKPYSTLIFEVELLGVK
ncbi:FKBP-type peptidyl-prolyl cis-trans isomerase [uncultured Bacteroides sp.]|uniref:FKBP-type peptidyl-prolyl cis-trans isomerase n=1 Tax=uncultured Bacteroides sp. TaxID=162156 RepID=UPI002AABC2F7|nr:FKBP-type peptidyl-prolyl cis-trans isomerase [uncultured Bacteroides sp.]